MKRLIAVLLLLVPIACEPAVSVDDKPKVYADVADCPPAWQECAAANGHTGVDSQPCEGVIHWVTTCGDNGEKHIDCLVKLDVPPAALGCNKAE